MGDPRDGEPDHAERVRAAERQPLRHHFGVLAKQLVKAAVENVTRHENATLNQAVHYLPFWYSRMWSGYFSLMRV